MGQRFWIFDHYSEVNTNGLEILTLSWRRKELKMKKNKRYKFVDWNGVQKGLEDTDSLVDAIQNAVNSECEVIDTQTSTGNQIVYSVWDGWNVEYDFYNKDIADFIMAEIKIKEQVDKRDMSFSSKELNMLSLGMLALIDNMSKAFGLFHNGKAYEILSKDLDEYHKLHNKICNMWMDAPDYKG